MPFHIDPRIAAWPIGRFVEKSWMLRVRCACGHEGRLAHAQLVEMPTERLVGDVVARLTCTSCGGSDGEVDMLQDRGGPTGSLRAAPETLGSPWKGRG